MLWQMFADPRPWILNGTAAFILQGMHPVIAAAVFDHSTVFSDPGRRAWRSLDAVMRWIYGGDRALDEARVMRAIHKDIVGVDFDGQRYHALQPEPFAWVWATAWLPAIASLELFQPEPVTQELKERLYEELKNLGRILGVQERCIPSTVDEFEAYWDDMIARLAAGHDGIAEGLGLFSRPPAPRFVPRLLWWPISVVAGRATIFLLAAGGPAEIRPLLEQHLGYSWTPKRQRAAERLITILRLGNKVPAPVRRLHEPALVRLARRRRFLTTEPSPSIQELLGSAALDPSDAPKCPADRPGITVLHDPALRRRVNSLRRAPSRTE
ncbi:hypothetical protein A7G45_25865 [Mycolicibacterium llatzerense]|nr:hypothetical protein [Mycolicibacterium llatzerense]